MTLFNKSSHGSEISLDWIPVRGDSMWPALRSGDEAGLERRERTPRAGDVVVARVAGAFLIHRVSRVTSASVVLRGDNCARSDPAVKPEAVVGVVRRVRRGKMRLEVNEWDCGPTLLGKWRVALKRRTAALLWRAE